MFLLRRRFIQQMTLRELVVVMLLLGIGYLAHDTDHKFQGEDGDVMRIGPAPAGLLYGVDVTGLANNLGVEPPTAVESYLGVRYDHLGMMDIDVLRWGGHLIVYEDRGTSLRFRDLAPDEIDTYDLRVPWRVYLPEGLIAILCLVELGLVARKPRTVRFALVAGGIAGVVALLFRIMGLTWESAMPGVIALHHLSIGIMPLLRRDEEEVAAPAEPIADEPPARPSAPPRRETAPKIGDDPFRSPPQAPPIVVQRASTEPSSVPVEHDENAAKPKLLT